MKLYRIITAAIAGGIVSIAPFSVLAADFPGQKTGDWIARDFKFHTGEVMPALKLHYTTIGDPSGQPVLVLHGTGGSGTQFLSPKFAGELFGAGQPLDASKYYIILPDGIGHGKSTKPSDGLKAAFPKYNYDDMVRAQYRLLTEGLGIKHVRLIIGNSMGGMQSWLWGEQYPGFMDALAPMASQPSEMAARNWLLRRAMLESIRNDPAYNNGDYTTQPPMIKYAVTAFRFASSGGTLAYQALAPTAAAVDKMYDESISAPFTADANDFVYQWSSSHDFNPSDALEKIEAPVLMINAADDERNPPETGVTEAALKRIKNARLFLIPPSTATRGHGTTASAKFYSQELGTFLQSVPPRQSK